MGFKKDWSKIEHCVYLLPKYNYVGMTSDLHSRMKVHRNNQGRDTSEVIILHEGLGKREARRLEKEYHAKGYLGNHN